MSYEYELEEVLSLRRGGRTASRRSRIIDMGRLLRRKGRLRRVELPGMGTSCCGFWHVLKAGSTALSRWQQRY
ncbi:hypothetical protein GCM10012286_03010 [Streptomyces lasiicapitis]|uniref:Uncharacterized protein n=1 Tax=Streptomyces lasiicapitis TaxID=1923961 RepID=A0ABQ2LHF3_9ACTN|nr:hypothetical protein GCM10012286_03010 [Streptomyces lasiicapitis]